MTTEIATITDSNKDLIRRNYCPTATPDEFEMFRAICNRYGLDPFCREAWFVKYGGSQAQIFVGRDGMLAIANRSGQFDGIETQPNFDDNGNLVSATCTVWRKDMSHPFTKTVYLKEYSTGKSLWVSKPITMLQKVAEAQALRAAFTISGLYCEEEMGDANTQPVKVEPKPTDIKVEVKPYVPPTTTGIATSSTTAKQEPIETEPIRTIATYPAFQVKSIMDNYQAHGYDMEIFSKAQLQNGDYDKQMIDDDYKRQMASEKTSDPSPSSASASPSASKQSKPTLDLCDESVVASIKEESTAERKHAIDQPFCVDCGNTRVLPDEEKQSRAKYGVALCPKCMSKRLANDLKAKQEAEAKAKAKALEEAGKEALQNLVNYAKQDANISKPAEPKTEPKQSESKQTKPTKTEDGCCSICGKKMTKGELSKWTLFNPGKPPVCSDCNKQE